MNKINLLIMIILINVQSCIKNEKVNLNKHNILSEGKLTKDSVRDGFWLYKDKEGNFLAKGDYVLGLKKGKWEYKDLKYNNSLLIDWTIYKESSFKLNLPADWEVKEVENSPVSIFFDYKKEEIYANGNITLIDANNKNINTIINEINKPYLEKKSYKFFSKKEVLINSINGYEINQSVKLNNRIIFIKIFVLKKQEDVFLLSFFCYETDIKLYNQLFTEIAFSFTPDSADL